MKALRRGWHIERAAEQSGPVGRFTVFGGRNGQHDMANGNSNGIGAMGFILGAVVVALAGLIWYVWSGGEVPSNNDATITIKVPELNN